MSKIINVENDIKKLNQEICELERLQENANPYDPNYGLLRIQIKAKYKELAFIKQLKEGADILIKEREEELKC